MAFQKDSTDKSGNNPRKHSTIAIYRAFPNMNKCWY